MRVGGQYFGSSDNPSVDLYYPLCVGVCGADAVTLTEHFHALSCKAGTNAERASTEQAQVKPEDKAVLEDKGPRSQQLERLNTGHTANKDDVRHHPSPAVLRLWAEQAFISGHSVDLELEESIHNSVGLFNKACSDPGNSPQGINLSEDGLCEKWI